MAARGNAQARQRRLEERLTGLDPRVLAVCERMHARELAYREQVFELHPALRVNQIPDRSNKRIGTGVIRGWLRKRQIFAAPPTSRAGDCYAAAFFLAGIVADPMSLLPK